MQILHKVAVIARFLNLTERRVQQLARDGIIPKAEKGKYDLVRCVAGGRARDFSSVRTKNQVRSSRTGLQKKLNALLELFEFSCSRHEALLL